MTEAIVKPRINKYDNIKGISIILIVLGHFLFIDHISMDLIP